MTERCTGPAQRRPAGSVCDAGGRTLRAVADPIEDLRAVAWTAPAHHPVLEPYLGKVRTRAYTVSDRDVDELRRAGVSEDEIFEATVSVACAEGLRRLDAAFRVIG
jgi:hypothetical protein